jgi:hypothetical protein
MDFNQRSEYRRVQYGALCWAYRRKTDMVGIDVGFGKHTAAVVSSGSSYSRRKDSRAIFIVEDRAEYLDMKDWLKKLMQKLAFVYVLQMDYKDGEKITPKDLIKGLGLMSGKSYGCNVHRKPNRNLNPKLGASDLISKIHGYNSRHTFNVLREMMRDEGKNPSVFNERAYAAAKKRSRDMLAMVSSNTDEKMTIRNKMYVAQDNLRRFMGQSLVDAVFGLGSVPGRSRYWTVDEGYSASDAKRLIEVLQQEVSRRNRTCQRCDVYLKSTAAQHDYGWRDPFKECFRCKDQDIAKDVQALHQNRRRQLKRERAALRKGKLNGKVEAT